MWMGEFSMFTHQVREAVLASRTTFISLRAELGLRRIRPRRDSVSAGSAQVRRDALQPLAHDGVRRRQHPLGHDVSAAPRALSFGTGGVGFPLFVLAFDLRPRPRPRWRPRFCRSTSWSSRFRFSASTSPGPTRTLWIGRCMLSTTAGVRRSGRRTRCVVRRVGPGAGDLPTLTVLAGARPRRVLKQIEESGIRELQAHGQHALLQLAHPRHRRDTSCLPWPGAGWRIPRRPCSARTVSPIGSRP